MANLKNTPPAPVPRPKPVKKPNRVGFVFLVIFLILLGVGGVLGGRGYSLLSAIGGSGGAGGAWAGITRPREQFPAKNRVNILVIGKDYSYNKNYELYTSASRSDTLILVSLDLDTKSVSGISIPRDTYIASERGKINAALGHGGVKLTRKVVGDLLGVVPDFHVVLKPDAVKEIVNLLGGVEVEAKDRMQYEDRKAGLHVDIAAGRQVITGEQAVGFVRYRKPDEYERDAKGNPIPIRGTRDQFVKRRNVKPSLEDGDDKRMARQQMLIKAMAQKAKLPQNLWHADTLLSSALKAVDTDLTQTQLLALATIFRTAQPEQIQTATLPGEEGFLHSSEYGRLWVFNADKDRTKHLVDWLVRGDEKAMYNFTVVVVRNNTNIKGAANRVADILKEKGFDARAKTGAGDAPTTRIAYGKASVAPRAQKIAELLGGNAVIVKDAALLETDTPPRRRKFAETAPDIAVLVGRDLAERTDNPTQRSAKL